MLSHLPQIKWLKDHAILRLDLSICEQCFCDIFLGILLLVLPVLLNTESNIYLQYLTQGIFFKVLARLQNSAVAMDSGVPRILQW